MSTTLEHTPVADLVAENDRLWSASSKASDAVTAIEYAAKEAVAADPVTITMTRTKPDGQVVTGTLSFIDGELTSEDDGLYVALYVLKELERADCGHAMSAADAEMWERWKEAKRVSIERAEAIRERVYRERGLEMARDAEERADAAAFAHSERLNNAPIRTMADAIAALQHIRDTNEDWRGLGDRALAFLREQAA